MYNSGQSCSRTRPYFLQECGEFLLASATKSYIKHKQKFKTFLCQVRIVKSFEKQSKWKDDIGLPEREYYQKLLAQLKCPLVYKEGLKFDF